MSWPVHEQVVGEPAPGLRGIVIRYVGYRLAGFEAGVHIALPSPNLTFVVTIDDPLQMVALPSGEKGPVSYDVLIGGLHTQHGLIAHDGRQHGVQIELSPLGVQRLFGVPSAALAQDVLAGHDLLGSVADELHERVSAAPSWRGRFRAIDDVFTRCVRSRERSPCPRPEVAWLWQRVLRSGGQVAAGDLAADIGWSRRHLAARFKAELGLTPKAAARVVRFDRARRMLARPNPGIAAVAASCGYADQSHLSREFLAFAGRPPARLFREDTTLASQFGEA